MKTVWKYKIPIEDEFSLEIPYGWHFLWFGLDPQGSPCVWLEVETTNPKREWGFSIAGTGGPIHSDSRAHLGSVTHGQFVWHLFGLKDFI